MNPGDILYTGHVVSEAEAREYNRQQARCDQFLKRHPVTAMKSGTLANREYNYMLNQKHRLFEAMALYMDD